MEAVLLNRVPGVQCKPAWPPVCVAVQSEHTGPCAQESKEQEGEEEEREEEQGTQRH